MNPPTLKRPSYRETLDWLFALQGLGIRPGLERITGLLAEMDEPHRAFPSVIVAGTNGKGSTCAFLASILTEAGLKTGLYTSPHLERFNERIRIGLDPVSDGAVVDAALIARKAAAASARTSGHPTFFEFTTAMAFDIFRRERVDIAVVEVGMGGRFDATNVVDPLAAVITTVALDHTGCLGTDLAEIAFEKSGVIKRDSTVVTGVTDPSPLAVIEGKAREKGSPLLAIGRDFTATPGPRAGAFSYRGPDRTLHDLATGLAGAHQARNAAVAVAAAGTLAGAGLAVTDEAVRRGLEKTDWPGRLEVVRRRPLFILDCAHNPAGAEALATELKGLRKGRLTLVMGVMKDKDSEGIFSNLVPLADRVIVTAPAEPRAADPSKLAALAGRHRAEVEVVETVPGAVRAALEGSGPDDTVVVTGSIFTVGEARCAAHDLP